MLSPTKRQLLPYALVVLFGYIGFSLPLPLLPEMFLDVKRSILPAGYSIEKKTFLLGLLMASYPLGQLIGSPFLGRLSDRFGRKKIILLSLAGCTVGYLITAYSTHMNFLWGIFLGLLTCGFAEGNIAIAQSVIADITEKDGHASKTMHFGWVNLFVTLGFIIGPLAGGKLADPGSVSWFTFATPFWMAAIMTTFGILIIAVFSKESRSAKLSDPFSHSLLSMLKIPGLKKYYVASFFFALAIFSFFRFFPVFVERTFDFTSSQIGYLIAYDSLAFAVALVWLIRPLADRFTPSVTLASFSILLAFFLIVALIPSSPYSLIWTIPPIGICLAICLTNNSVLISNSVSSNLQGQALGTFTSIQVLAEVLTGIGGGILAGGAPPLPLYIGAAMAVVAALILFASIRGVGDIFRIVKKN